MFFLFILWKYYSVKIDRLLLYVLVEIGKRIIVYIEFYIFNKIFN